MLLLCLCCMAFPLFMGLHFSGKSRVPHLSAFFWWDSDKFSESRHPWGRRALLGPGESYEEGRWAWSSVLLTFGQMGPRCIIY